LRVDARGSGPLALRARGKAAELGLGKGHPLFANAGKDMNLFIVFMKEEDERVLFALRY